MPKRKISEVIKSFGGSGRIHGCIIDVDFLNHVMLNPSDGQITYYYSPVFGYVEPYDNMLNLLESHNKELAMQYRKQIGSSDSELIVKNKMTDLADLVKIDIKNSIYTISNRMNQIQRLFDKRILREWNDELLINDMIED